jgi:hypothetical protein
VALAGRHVGHLTRRGDPVSAASSGQGWPRSDRRKPTIWMITARDSPVGRRQRSCRPSTVMAPRPSESSPPPARPPSLPAVNVLATQTRPDATGCALTAGDAVS